MDNILLFIPDMKSHEGKLKDLHKTLLKNGLKISPKMCQLFTKEYQYIGTKTLPSNFKHASCGIDKTTSFWIL